MVWCGSGYTTQATPQSSTVTSMPRGTGNVTSDLHGTSLSPGQWPLKIKDLDCYLNLQIPPLPLLTLSPAPETLTKRCQSQAGGLFLFSLCIRVHLCFSSGGCTSDVSFSYCGSHDVLEKKNQYYYVPNFKIPRSFNTVSEGVEA